MLKSSGIFLGCLTPLIVGWYQLTNRDPFLLAVVIVTSITICPLATLLLSIVVRKNGVRSERLAFVILVVNVLWLLMVAISLIIGFVRSI